MDLSMIISSCVSILCSDEAVDLANAASNVPPSLSIESKAKPMKSSATDTPMWSARVTLVHSNTDKDTSVREKRKIVT